MIASIASKTIDPPDTCQGTEVGEEAGTFVSCRAERRCAEKLSFSSVIAREKLLMRSSFTPVDFLTASQRK